MFANVKFLLSAATRDSRKAGVVYPDAIFIMFYLLFSFFAAPNSFSLASSRNLEAALRASCDCKGDEMHLLAVSLRLRNENSYAMAQHNNKIIIK